MLNARFWLVNNQFPFDFSDLRSNASFMQRGLWVTFTAQVFTGRCDRCNTHTGSLLSVWLKQYIIVTHLCIIYTKANTANTIFSFKFITAQPVNVLTWNWTIIISGNQSAMYTILQRREYDFVLLDISITLACSYENMTSEASCLTGTNECMTKMATCVSKVKQALVRSNTY